MYFEIVQTIAEVSGALIGFVGVVFVLGKRAVRQLTVVERNGIAHLFVGAAGTLIFSILIMVLLAFFENEAIAWRIGSAIMATYLLLGASKAIVEELRGEHSLPKPFNWALPITAEIIAILNVATALGYFEHLLQLSCVLALLLGLVVAISYFISLLTGYHDVEKS